MRVVKAENEKYSPIIRIISIPIIGFLNLLPAKISRFIFLAFSGKEGDTIAVFNGVATFKALEVMYTFPQRRAGGRVNRISIFWENFLGNARAIRNRLYLVKEEIVDAVVDIAQEKESINILSVGSGSARPVFDAIKSLNGRTQVNLMLVDMNEEAIRFGQGLAQYYGINHTAWWCGNFFRLEQHCRNFYPDLIEMVGLLDYLSRKQAVVLLAKVFRVLAPGGYLITGNIAPNFEAPFVTKGINWPMVYRKPSELADILVEAGFPTQNIRITQEPLGIHTLAIAQKLV